MHILICSHRFRIKTKNYFFKKKYKTMQPTIYLWVTDDRMCPDEG